MKTAIAGGPTVEYLRDVTGRIVQRTETPSSGAATVVRYGFAGAGDSASLVMDAGNIVNQRTLGLPGGVMVAYATGQSRSYPSLHGDITITADQVGVRNAGIYQYEPFGQPMGADGKIGTLITDDAGPNTVTGDADWGWLGGHRKLTEHAGSIATIEMGARQYVPALGRFLEVDPIEGGVTNNYDYLADPINRSDLSGERQCVGNECYTKTGSALHIGRNGSVSGRTQPAPVTSKIGPSAPSTPAPPTCGGAYWCKSADYKLTACFEYCVAMGAMFREDGVILGSFELGVGARAEVSFTAGTGYNRSAGLGVGGGGSGAFGVGYYGEGGVGLGTAKSWGLPYPTLSPEFGHGIEYGIGAGVSVMGGLTAELGRWR